jgi:hypothetical protein
MVMAPMYRVPWGPRESWQVSVNPHFTKEVMLHERARYMEALNAPKVTLLSFLEAIGVLPEDDGGEPKRGFEATLAEWPADQQQTVLTAIRWALNQHSGIVFYYLGSKQSGYEVIFPLAWDGDYLPIGMAKGSPSESAQ